MIARQRITVFSQDIPYPPTHGGRVDIWRRLKALSLRDVDIQLIFWSNETISTQVDKTLLSICSEYIVFSVNKTILSRCRQLYYLTQFPLKPVEYMVSTPIKEVLSVVSLFKPDIVWLDGFQAGLTALLIAKKTGCQLFYRSHNIEHHYMQELIKSSTKETSLKFQAYLYLEKLHLKSFEIALMKKADKVFDISYDDSLWWQKNYHISHSVWLPPLIDKLDVEKLGNCSHNIAQQQYDLIVVGNLRSPNNIMAIKWLIEKVMPLIWRQRKNISLLISGSFPSDDIKHLITSDKRLFIIENPKSISTVLNCGRVLLNPAQRGSGVNLKTIDMLSVGKPFVGTPQSLSGLPGSLKKLLGDYVTIECFTNRILELLDDSSLFPAEEIEQLLTLYFGDNRIELLLNELKVDK